MTNPLITELNERIDFSNINPNHILEAANYSIIIADSILNEILTVKDSLRTFENTMLNLDHLYNTISKVWNPIELLASVSENEKIRFACDESNLFFSSYVINLSSNLLLYKAIQKYSKSAEVQSLPVHRKRFLESELYDFKNSGLGLNSDKQDELKKIQNNISELKIKFTNNINNYRDTIFVEESLMQGLSESFKNERYVGNGLYQLDLSYPTFYPFMENSKSDSIRKLLRTKFLNKGMPENIDLLDEIINLRNQYANLLGYPTFASFTIKESMAGAPESVLVFLNDLREKNKYKADWDTKQLLKVKNKLSQQRDTMVYDWEKYYYENKLLQSLYNVNGDEVKEYFKLENVISGLFEISQQLFGIKYRQIFKPSVWNYDVRMYEIYESSSDILIGTFYLDLFPRENKYSHAAEYTIYSGKKIGDNYQLPVACLVCNFPKGTTKIPSLLSHDDVETYFHEFGHLIHDLLSKTELSSQSGTSVLNDFVEAPSQMLENWVWNRDALKLFAKHYKTGKIIPDSLLNRLLASRQLQSGNDLLQQVFYSMLDISLHNGFEPDGSLSTKKMMMKLQRQITHYPHIPGTNQLASFDHLLDYSASYYGYLWSEVYAVDMFSIFEQNGVMDNMTGMRFRKLILEKGDSDNPMSLVQKFLGREPDNSAFLIKLGITE
jgi:thimet oligopeptidase